MPPAAARESIINRIGDVMLAASRVRPGGALSACGCGRAPAAARCPFPNACSAFLQLCRTRTACTTRWWCGVSPTASVGVLVLQPKPLASAGPRAEGSDAAIRLQHLGVDSTCPYTTRCTVAEFHHRPKRRVLENKVVDLFQTTRWRSPGTLDQALPLKRCLIHPSRCKAHATAHL